MINFYGRVILITGAARGLGFAYARCLAEAGATVLLQDVGADRDGRGEDPRIVAEAARTLRNDGFDAEALCGGIASRDACRALVDAALAVRGRLDGVIHNAGWVAYETIMNVREDSFDRMIGVAVKAPLWLAQAAWPVMQAARYGRIVLTTSDRALYPEYVQTGLASYAAAKLAAVGLVNVLAKEGAPDGIVVNAISPVARTRMWGETGEPDDLRPRDVAPGAAFLVSDACTQGGWVLRAGNGQFHATRSCEAAGVDYPRDLHGVAAATVAEVAAQWPRIAVPAVEPRA
ncbi:SDR family NAD(P)-dependent oxidoreductase [Sphingomonas melonis]|uniref:NAD(P)-dependent dehydrogenase (Short-subunit alcohol dehydrogenase family) n=1 Tax=Sphingomonas melonis TaxID=152682 RepID=A0A7Y9K4C1_9SPHN|nr:SDR family oxidoreductase [Sphingomonas melonis]NYD91220.1 NAD(P)-dependent dehydrogenase (short-subunit alcohol dehydrogenase family) [Sphingomonas melonis]